MCIVDFGMVSFLFPVDPCVEVDFAASGFRGGGEALLCVHIASRSMHRENVLLEEDKQCYTCVHSFSK